MLLGDAAIRGDVGERAGERIRGDFDKREIDADAGTGGDVGAGHQVGGGQSDARGDRLDRECAEHAERLRGIDRGAGRATLGVSGDTDLD
jgi:hypothetical protein